MSKFIVSITSVLISFRKLRTSWGKGLVSTASTTKDPLGGGRARRLELTRDDHTIGTVNKEGSVYWGKADIKTMGKTIVSTSLGRASLYFE